MTGQTVTTQSTELQALRALSARVGADPVLVQAAGGNTSIKEDGILWIKASGTWLAKALTDDIMVPVSLEALYEGMRAGHPDAEKATPFVVTERNPSGLRPSIETTVHAVMPQTVVVHVHCVETIATAVRMDADRLLADRLAGLNYAHIPYVKPGLNLSNAIASRLKPDTDVLILGNHGLVVAAETVEAAGALLRDVSGRLAAPARTAPAPDLDALHRLAQGSAYGLPEDAHVHAAATDLTSCEIAAGGSLYPDHVVFLGPAATVAAPGQSAAEAAADAMKAGRPEPVLILFPGKGALLAVGATPGAKALARCLADVTARIPGEAPIRYLTPEEDAVLLDWDAEKYRQALNAALPAGRA